MDAVKLGYKLTEVGVIPKDWEMKPLGEITEIVSGGTPKTGIPEYWDGGIAWCTPTDITNETNKYLTTTARTISLKGLQNSSARLLPAGTLLLCSRATIGEIRIATNEICTNQGFKSLICGKYVLNEFLYYMLLTMKQKMIEAAIGSTFLELTKKDAAHLNIALPPLPEQHAIAEVLDDIDDKIAALDALITKKRGIKQGAMEELLTGRRSLPRISDERKLVNMAENSRLKARIGWQGLTTAEYLEFGDYHLVTGTDFVNGRIDWEKCYFVDEHRYDQDRNIQLCIGDVLLTKDGTIGKVAYIDFLPAQATLNSGVFVIRPINKAYHAQFLYYVLTSSIFSTFLAQLQAGSTINHLYQKDFVAFSFSAPSYSEQEAIANLINDMDAEINALVAQREKTVALGQGMVQELLTGKMRLI